MVSSILPSSSLVSHVKTKGGPTTTTKSLSPMGNPLPSSYRHPVVLPPSLSPDGAEEEIDVFSDSPTRPKGGKSGRVGGHIRMMKRQQVRQIDSLLEVSNRSNWN